MHTTPCMHSYQPGSLVRGWQGGSCAGDMCLWFSDGCYIGCPNCSSEIPVVPGASGEVPDRYAKVCKLEFICVLPCMHGPNATKVCKLELRPPRAKTQQQRHVNNDPCSAMVQLINTAHSRTHARSVSQQRNVWAGAVDISHSRTSARHVPQQRYACDLI